LLKILKKLRTASLNSKFTGSYKKKCTKKFKFTTCKILFHICFLGQLDLTDTKADLQIVIAISSIYQLHPTLNFEFWSR